MNNKIIKIKRDRTGETIGFLTVLSFAGRKLMGGQLRSMWLCRCRCGKEIEDVVIKIGGNMEENKGLVNSAFERALQRTLIFEGGYSNSSEDA